MLEEVFRFIKEKGRLIVLSLTGVVFLLLVIILWLFFQRESQDLAPGMDIYEELLAEEAEQIEADQHNAAANGEKGPEESITAEEIVVDVKGAVHAPGVYTMEENSRIFDAIEKAGGLAENAEQKAVNLAQVIEDQMVIYVPIVGEEGVDLAHLNQKTAGEEDEATSKVDLNLAEKDELMTLNGIGSSKADSILSYREENGNFQSVDEIKNVSGIGEATFANLKDFIVVGP